MILVSASCATSRGQTRDGAGGGGPIIQRSSDGRGRIRPRIRGYYIVHAIRHTSGRYAILVRVNAVTLTKVTLPTYAQEKTESMSKRGVRISCLRQQPPGAL